MQQQEQLSVAIDGDDQRGLLALAALSKVDEADAPRFQALVHDALRRGLASRLADVGLSWSPSPGEVREVLEQLAALEARATKQPPTTESPPAPDASTSAGAVLSAAPASTTAPTPSGNATEPPRSGRSGPRRLNADRRRSVVGDHRLQSSSLALASLAFAVALVGGYAGHWSWTGFTANRQLWNWMQLLLLPLALGTFPLWLRFAAHMSRLRRQLLFGAVAAFGLFVAAGYLWPLLWTGFRGNTLWDWLNLLLLPVALTTLRLWPTTRREIRPGHVVALAAFGAGWLTTIIGGYGDHWAWTGYQGNTLWDWLQLLLAPIAVNTAYIQAAVRWISGDVANLAKRAADDEARRAAWLEIRSAAAVTSAAGPAHRPDARAPMASRRGPV